MRVTYNQERERFEFDEDITGSYLTKSLLRDDPIYAAKWLQKLFDLHDHLYTEQFRNG